jgi:hypothetical protein
VLDASRFRRICDGCSEAKLVIIADAIVRLAGARLDAEDAVSAGEGWREGRWITEIAAP